MSRDRWFLIVVQVGEPDAVYGPYDDDDKASIDVAAGLFSSAHRGTVAVSWHRTTARPPARDLAKTFKAKAAGVLAAEKAAKAARENAAFGEGV